MFPVDKSVLTKLSAVTFPVKFKLPLIFPVIVRLPVEIFGVDILLVTDILFADRSLVVLILPVDDILPVAVIFPVAVTFPDAIIFAAIVKPDIVRFDATVELPLTNIFPPDIFPKILALLRTLRFATVVILPVILAARLMNKFPVKLKLPYRLVDSPLVKIGDNTSTQYALAPSLMY